MKMSDFCKWSRSEKDYQILDAETKKQMISALKNVEFVSEKELLFLMSDYMSDDTEKFASTSTFTKSSSWHRMLVELISQGVIERISISGREGIRMNPIYLLVHSSLQES